MYPNDFLDFVFDHLDLNTAELIASGNYKQALKSLDKRRKKDDARYTQIVRATIAYRLHDYDASLDLLNEYVKLYRPSYGPDVCERLYISLYALKTAGKDVKDKQLEDVFIQSIAAEKDQEEKAGLARDWMFLAIGRAQWHFVVKASQQLATIPSADSTVAGRQWTLQICARYLQHIKLQQRTGAGSELDRRLALQTLRKAAKDAPHLLATSIPLGKCISAEHQLRLLVEIYRRENQEGELLELLNDPRFSAIVEGNSEFDNIKADLHLRNPLDARKDVTEWVSELLQKNAGEGGQWLRDDWQIWRLLATELAQSPNPSEMLRRTKLDYGPSTPMDRAASLAQLDLISRHTRSSTYSPQLHKALKDYFDAHQDKDVLPMDLEPYAKTLSLSDKVAFATTLHEVLSSAEHEISATNSKAQEHLKWLRIATNALTVDRLLLANTIPAAMNGASEYPDLSQLMTCYATLALDLYARACRVNELSPERTPASGAAKSALEDLIWALTAIYHTTNDTSVSLLRRLCYSLPSRTQSTTEWRLQLISDLQGHGASSYAWSFYDKMDIRHITVDGTAPLMFCRMSMIYHEGTKGFKPGIEIKKYLDSYREALDKIPHYQDMALDKDHEAQCIGMHDLLHEVCASPVRWMLGLEKRRIARLQRSQLDEDDMKFAPEHMPRTLSSTTRKPWAYATGLFTTTYVQFLAHLDDLSRLATCEPAIEQVILERLRARQAEHLHNTSAVDDLQHQERTVLSSYMRLVVVFEGLLVGSPDLVNEALQQLLKKLNTLRVPQPQGGSALPSYHYFLHSSLSLELIDILLRSCKKILVRMKRGYVKTNLSSIERTAKEAADAIRGDIHKRIGELNKLSKIQNLAKELATPANLKPLADDVSCMLGVGSAEAHLRETVVSCRLSLESLLSIKSG